MGEREAGEVRAVSSQEFDEKGKSERGIPHCASRGSQGGQVRDDGFAGAKRTREEVLTEKSDGLTQPTNTKAPGVAWILPELQMAASRP